LINNPSVANAAVIAFGTAFLVMRIHCEESLLLEYWSCVFTARSRCCSSTTTTRVMRAAHGGA
jgi:hypothetical protein